LANPSEPRSPSEKIVLTRIRPEKNERRFYAIDIAHDMFGHMLVSRNCGRIGTSGRQRYDPYPNLRSAQHALDAIAKSKRKRGYVDAVLSPNAAKRNDDALAGKQLGIPRYDAPW
jgi:predicted DNA-binding WGR domain protein